MDEVSMAFLRFASGSSDADLESLVEAGADLSARDGNGRNALMLALISDAPQAVWERRVSWLAGVCDAGAVDGYGDSALSFLAGSAWAGEGRDDGFLVWLAKILLDRGAPVGGEGRKSPLRLAVAGGQMGLTLLFLERGLWVDGDRLLLDAADDMAGPSRVRNGSRDSSGGLRRRCFEALAEASSDTALSYAREFVSSVANLSGPDVSWLTGFLAAEAEARELCVMESRVPEGAVAVSP